jgi:hypothetical protein
LLGEPFLKDDILYYFDGETLTIVGYLLDETIKETLAIRKLSNLVVELLAVHSPDFLNYYGPWYLDFLYLLENRYSMIFSSEPNPYHVDILLDLTHPSLLKTRNARESMRKTRVHGFMTYIVDRAYLGYEHINLIRQLVSNRSLELSDVNYMTRCVAIIKNKSVKVFETRFNQKLTGFGIAHEYFDSIPFLVMICLDETFPGASDAIYSKIIQYYQERGAKWLGLGYSVHEGLYKYKLKWGPVRCNMPFYQSIYVRCGTKIKSIECLHWTCRLIVDKRFGHLV